MFTKLIVPRGLCHSVGMTAGFRELANEATRELESLHDYGFGLLVMFSLI